MLDRCEFSAPPTSIIRDAQRYFQVIGKIDKVRPCPDLMQFRDSIVSQNEETLQFVQKGIYSDLPDNETLKSVKQVFPKNSSNATNARLCSPCFSIAPNRIRDRRA
jgi:hypothetical protein